jgi:L,D-transpeptidase ErfK/SrfK
MMLGMSLGSQLRATLFLVFIMVFILVFTLAMAGPMAWAIDPALSPVSKDLAVSKELKRPGQPASTTRLEARRIEINVAECRLRLLEGRKVLATYPVGLGRPGFRTPLGAHQVLRMVDNPAWENPYKAPGASRIKAGPMNPLGTRWIGFKNDPHGEFGMHGTDRPQSVGKYSSHGCVRMKVPDAEALYSQIKVGTPVDVVYRPYQVTESGGKLSIQWLASGLSYGLPKPSAKAITDDLTTRFSGYQLQTQDLQRWIATPAATALTVIGTKPLSP